MSFQAYLDNIKVKTGKTPEDFKKIAEKKGLLKPNVKAGEIVAWLKKDFELGHGHAMAIYTVFKGLKEQKSTTDEMINKHFSNAKFVWRALFDDLLKKMKKFGPDISIAPAASYLSIQKGESKIGIIQVSTGRMDIGIKLKGVSATSRLETAGNWNAMVTHRVRVTDPKQIDKELLGWLFAAYNGSSQ